MQGFKNFEGVVVPINKSNIDTDQIIPKQYLKSIKRTGFGPALFDKWRYLDEGQPGQDHTKRPVNPDFVLNHPVYGKGNILVAGENFGCGSSREHAPWALVEYGFRVVIAPSFADIFYNNSFKNGLLLIVLPQESVSTIITRAVKEPGYRLAVSLTEQSVSDTQGFSQAFAIDAFRKMALLEGLDEIGMTLKSSESIRAYEQRRRAVTPWMFKDLPA